MDVPRLTPEPFLAGVYERKGQPYLIIGLARMHEGGEEYVAYVPLYQRPDFAHTASISLRTPVDFRAKFKWAGPRVPPRLAKEPE